ncbi:polynucleotide kinase [Serratia phage SP1]|nr:polynucleotide kinase [Serratia phage SP1]
MTKQVILTVGAPGSGKSTWAEDLTKTNTGFVNLNRDQFRIALFSHDPAGRRLTKHQEKMVVKAQVAAATELLNQPHVKGIIISDTNLNPKTTQVWKDFAFTRKAQYIEKHFFVPLTELYKRNLKRGVAAVPRSVIYDMFQKHYTRLGEYKYIPVPGTPDAVIYDLDGTLAIHNGRSPHDLDKLGSDLPNELVIKHLLFMQSLGYKIITVSGRESGPKDDPTKWFHGTKNWLEHHGVKSDYHIQRKHGDHRQDWIVKKEIFMNHIAPFYNVKLAVDDRDQVVDMWRTIGVPCWQVNHGDF